MARFVFLAAIAAGLYWLWRSYRGETERIVPYIVIGLALLYLINPVDLIPDASAVGVLDDLAVLAAAIVWARRQMGAQQQSRPESPRPGAGSEPDPHEVLGVPRGASPEEITRAYREKMKLYHPDRVNDLGEELREVATRKTIEIRQAYETLRRAKS